MWMCTEFSCPVAHPTLLSAPLAFSWMFFFGLYGPPYPGALIHVGRCRPQSLKGTLSLPTVQSNRGSTVSAIDALNVAFRVFHAGSVKALGSPVVPSTTKKLSRFCDGWWKPQHPNGLPECGKFSR